MSMNELNTTARDLMSVRAMIEELQAEAEALTDKLKAAMVEQGTETLQEDGWKASWKNVNSQGFDSKAFEEDATIYWGDETGISNSENYERGFSPQGTATDLVGGDEERTSEYDLGPGKSG